ncbi:MAG: DUF1801 domain-containing protein [Chloroflexi bacterium]|nr:DUF1801 domain-containing protein [Chloroflexota bacterium]
MTSTKPTKRTDTSTSGGLTADEKAAMRDRVREAKAEARRGSDRAAGEADLLAKVAQMPPSDRAMAERIHEIVTETAPELMPKTWYGMPAYARDGKIVCFFQAADKFKARYATFGFDQEAELDDGAMWPTSWALTKLTPADEKRIAALVKQAVSRRRGG